VKLLNQQAAWWRRLASSNKKNSQSVFCAVSRKDMLQRLKPSKGPLSNQAVQDVFYEIVHACRSLREAEDFVPGRVDIHAQARSDVRVQAELMAVTGIADVFRSGKRPAALW